MLSWSSLYCEKFMSLSRRAALYRLQWKSVAPTSFALLGLCQGYGEGRQRGESRHLLPTDARNGVEGEEDLPGKVVSHEEVVVHDGEEDDGTTHATLGSGHTAGGVGVGVGVGRY